MKTRQTRYNRSMKHILLAVGSVSVATLIGILSQFWFFGFFFGVLLLAMSLWHYMYWNNITNLHKRRGGGAKQFIDEDYKDFIPPRDDFEDLMFDPTLQGSPINIYHEK